MRGTIATVLVATTLGGCAQTQGGPGVGLVGAPRRAVASFYHEPQRVSCGGGRFSPMGLTTAHRHLPCGSIVRVARGDRTVDVTVNDCGPAAWTKREFDLSRGAARAVGLEPVGVGAIDVVVLEYGRGGRVCGSHKG